MASPHPIPTHLKLLRGNPGRRPLNRNEPQPAIPAEVPEPPPFLSDYAQAHWREKAPELHRLGLLTVLDLPAFGTYCAAYGHWQAAEEALVRGDGLTAVGSTGNRIVSPLWRVASEAARNVVRFGSEFGLTPSSRTKVAVREHELSKFAGLLA